jgi:antitoxin PrlF
MTDFYEHAAEFDPDTIAGSALGITFNGFGITVDSMTKLTAKGQVTIPRRVREYLGLSPGAEVDFDVTEDGRVFLRPHGKAPESRFARLRGSAKLGMTTDEIMALTRGEDPD